MSQHLLMQSEKKHMLNFSSSTATNLKFDTYIDHGEY